MMTGFVVGAANANPPGCSQSKPVLLASGAGYLTAYGYGDCTTSETRTFYIEIKWQKALFPDPVVARNSKHAALFQYRPNVSSCDNGNTRAYFANSYFGTTTGDTKASATKTVTTCS
jgi:hypothetical protein